MSKLLQPVRGTHDLLGDAMHQHRFICDTAREITHRYGFAEMMTPLFEFSTVFHRTLGETSDVVSKETYSFEDRGGESLTLRPEFTASIVRAFLSNGLTQQLPFKAFYAGPAFRYERPQKGRQRQFHQIGVELLGGDKPWHDTEVIACSAQLLNAFGLENSVTLEVNSLGDSESRAAYRTALVAYLRDHQQDLSPESQARLEANPLRILDSKQEQDRNIVINAPAMEASLTSEASDWFARVKEGLDCLGISYMVNPQLVRGLDYYTHTVFEWTTDALGAQNTVLAGGRYDGLVARMGGPEIPGTGWAAGVERLALVNRTPVETEMAPGVVIPLSENEMPVALQIAQKLRKAGKVAEIIWHRNTGKALKKANGLGAEYALLIGEEEVAHNTITVKNLSQGTQETVAQDALIAYINA